MRDDNEGFLGFIDNLHEHVNDTATGAGIEIAGGLVGVDDAGVVDECSGDGDALLLTARKFSGQMLEACAEADLVQQFTGACLGILPADHGCQHHIFERRELWQQEIVLEDKTHDLIARAGTLRRCGLIQRTAMYQDIS